MKRTRDRRGQRGRGKTTEYTPDPSLLFEGEGTAQTRRKQEQLCRQVEERLGLVLAGEIDDPLVQDLYVVGVHAEPGGANLIVSLAFPPGRDDRPTVEALRRLEALRPFLRGEIASAIHRKRTPGLTFRIVRPELLAGGVDE